MSDVSPFAGKPLPQAQLANVPLIVAAYYTEKPDPAVAAERVSFGTSGHRGASLARSFNETHILAIAQAIAEHRQAAGIDGPLYIGIDTHALSEPAFRSALEVLAANDVTMMIDGAGGYTPTPVISHAILAANRGRKSGLADGIVITPSHNPPEDGGFKYNPPSGGPADEKITKAIETRANTLIAEGLRGVRRIGYARARARATEYDFVTPYVTDLAAVVDLDLIRGAGVKIGIDPLGGAAVHYWDPIVDRYGIDAEVVNGVIDPSFRFMPADADGKIRMDCSSPYAMRGLLALAKDYDVAFANDTDADRHGIVTKSGLMNPNHYLAASIAYLFANRPAWRKDAAIGKTIVSSGIIDRVAAGMSRRVVEVPVGFKWFVDGLADGSFGFVGEESAGASFLRSDGGVWTTDKDGLIMGLLAAEITAKTGADPGVLYGRLTEKYGRPFYRRTDAPAGAPEKSALKQIGADALRIDALAGEPIVARLVTAPGNESPIGGIKIVTKEGWFAARPSGTEDVYKIYAESFKDETHLTRIEEEAKAAVLGFFADAKKPAP